MTTRRAFLSHTGASILIAGSMARVLGSTTPAKAHAPARRPARGYGDLVPDPRGLLDLPEGFCYRVLSSEGDTLSDGSLVPSSHDGMAAFSAGWFGTWLVRNHEMSPEDIEEDGLIGLAHVRGAVYDPDVLAGGTTTLLVRRDRSLLRHHRSLSGTLDNCAGGPTPWGTWLTCEENADSAGKPHGYVFEVDPWRGGDPRPIVGMGRFEHEAVAIGRDGTAYLSEDADEPFGCLYRYLPRRPRGGRGSLHAGGALEALVVPELLGSDLSIVQEPGTVLDVRWIPVPNANPADGEASTREQSIGLGAAPIQKCEGTWTAHDGSIWFVGSRGDGPDAEDEEDRSAAAHAGQIWCLDPRQRTVELVTIFPVGSPWDGPDNITIGPHGFALVCSDGKDDQWLVGINERGEVFPFALNPADDAEFAGATFSPDGETLFVNTQGQPARTFAIWGPWRVSTRP
jgi:secreted PhoX family phosphatase